MSLHTLLERLADMFPKQDYQFRLENYIKSQSPESSSEIERLIHTFETKEAGGQRL